MNWTPTRMNTLQVMWEDCAVSTDRIAKELGTTRNAIIGKAHRMGLSPRTWAKDGARRRARYTPEEREARKREVHRKASERYRRNRGMQPRWQSERKVRPEPVLPPTCQPISLLDLGRIHCRFPIGEPAGPATMFCGAARADELPYCEYHARVAYQPPKDWERSNSHAIRLAGHDTPHLVPA